MVSRHPVFWKSFLIKAWSLVTSLHAAPAHFVMRMLLCLALSLSCHSPKPLIHLLSHFCLVHSTKPSINGLDLVSMVLRPWTNNCIHLMSARIMKLFILLECYIIYENHFLFYRLSNTWNKCFCHPLDVYFTVHLCTALEIDIHTPIVLCFFISTYIPFTPENNGRFDILFPFSTNTKLQCSLLLSRPLEG